METKIVDTHLETDARPKDYAGAADRTDRNLMDRLRNMPGAVAQMAEVLRRKAPVVLAGVVVPLILSAGCGNTAEQPIPLVGESGETVSRLREETVSSYSALMDKMEADGAANGYYFVDLSRGVGGKNARAFLLAEDVWVGRFPGKVMIPFQDLKYIVLTPNGPKSFETPWGLPTSQNSTEIMLVREVLKEEMRMKNEGFDPLSDQVRPDVKYLQLDRNKDTMEIERVLILDREQAIANPNKLDDRSSSVLASLVIDKEPPYNSVVMEAIRKSREMIVGNSSFRLDVEGSRLKRANELNEGFDDMLRDSSTPASPKP